MNSLSRCKPLLGTYVEITVNGDVSDQELIKQSNRSFSEIEAIHKRMSFHDSSSELFHLNQNAFQREISLSQPMLDVFTAVTQLHTLSHGLFDPCIASELIKQKSLPSFGRSISPNHGRWKDIEINEEKIKFHAPLLIDLGGIAKGYAVDRAIDCVDDHLSMVVNAGGDIRFTNWQEQTVFIKSPSKNSHSDIKINMKGPAIATSASYFNGGLSVMIDPSTSTTVNSTHSVSVFANSCLVADALTKVVWLTTDHQKILKHYDAQTLVIDSKNQVVN